MFERAWRFRQTCGALNPDLFWAIRGGGGNFGVAVSLEYTLHQVGPTITASVVVHPWGEHSICCGIGPMPYTILNGMLDGAFPRGARSHWKARFVSDLSDDAIRAVIAGFENCPSAMSHILIEHFHGGGSRVPVTATACTMRVTGFNVVIASQWAGPDETQRGITWARETFATLAPYLRPTRHINYLEEDATDAATIAYGPNLPPSGDQGEVRLRKCLRAQGQHPARVGRRRPCMAARPKMAVPENAGASLRLVTRDAPPSIAHGIVIRAPHVQAEERPSHRVPRIPAIGAPLGWARRLPPHQSMRMFFVAAGCIAVLVIGGRDLNAQTADGPRGPAWDALRAGNHEEAERAFRTGLRLRPADPLLNFGLGVALHAQQRSDDARAPLTRALEIEPRFTAAAALLGQILYASGDLEGAIGLYERALTNVSGVPTMRARLDRWRTEARVHAGYEQGGDGRFSVLFDGPEERSLASRVHRVLESAYWRIGARLNTYPGETIPVILYTQQQFRDVTGSPTWAAGAYDGRIRLAVRGGLQDADALDRVVVHEFVHALVQRVAPRGVPAWLHEGLAVNLAEGEPGWPDGILAASSQSIPLSSLERGFSGLDSTAAALAYAESAVAVGVLMRRLGPNLPAFLQSLGGAGTLDAGLAAFGFTTADLDSAVRARARSR